LLEGSPVVTVHNFSYGLLNPALAYLVSCLGAFLGLRCVTRARACQGLDKAGWLSLAAVSVGATGIWAMHFIAMLGFTIPGQQITYNVALTIASMLIAIAVVGVGLFIVGFSNGGWKPLLTGGVIIGIGVASMHYLGMSAMIMPDTMSYNPLLFILSVIIAIVAGTAALWAGTRVRGIGATVAASLIMGVAVSGMHYTGMAAMHVFPAQMSMSSMGSGTSGQTFLVPLLLGITLVTFGLALIISLSPSEDEIHTDAMLRGRLDAEVASGSRAGSQGGSSAPRVPASRPVATTAPVSPNGFTPGGYAQVTDSGTPATPQPQARQLPIRRPGGSRRRPATWKQR
jgi:NO-binding membrane sensor protein with MHYT domain